MKMKMFLVLMGLSSSLIAESLPLKVCSDLNFWFPFTFVGKDNKIAGLHIDIIRQSLNDLGYNNVTFEALPWKQCLLMAESGEVDGVATASYKDDRAKFMFYPEDAKTAKESRFRVTQAEYIIVTEISSTYNYTGDNKTLPQPVRAPLGYSIVDDLKKDGLVVETTKSSEGNLKKMLRDKNGVSIVIPEEAKYYLGQDEFKGKLKIHTTPISSKSYYFAVAQKGKIKAAEAMKIWEQIAKVREEKGHEFIKKYNTQN